MPSLLQQLKQQAQMRGGTAGAPSSPVMLPPEQAAPQHVKPTSSMSAVRCGLIIAFVVVLVIGVVLVVNRLHEQSHNANIVDRDDSEWQDLDAEAPEPRTEDPHFTPLSELI